jgi:hypothetical protein
VGLIVQLPEGITQITESIRLNPYGEVLRGAGRGLSILQVMTPGIDAVILDCGSPSELPTRNTISDLTIRTYQPGVTGIRGIGASANTIRDIGFQGPTFTINLDRGLHNTIDTVYAEPFEGRPVGTLLIGSSDPTRYSHYTTIRGYQTRGPCGGWVAIFNRATNVSAAFMVHAPECNGILVTDDSQGLMFEGWIVAATNGVVLSAVDGRRPSFVDTRRLHLDQSADFGVRIHAGTDIDVGGQITNGGQGILIGAYPEVERVQIDARLATHHDNGVVALPGARYWSMIGGSACGTGGAAVVVSNHDGDDYTVALNDFSQGNGAGYVGPSTGGRRLIVGNR